MERVRILFLAANPATTTRLALDEEVREIEAKIRAAEHRDAFELITKWAVRPDDLLQALNQHRPHVVHFSGHGNDSEELLLASESGHTRPVSSRALTHLFRTLGDAIRVVVLNACYSQPQAEAIAEHVDCVVGMRRAIGNRAAQHFASSFYRALAFGCSLKNAFEQGLVSLELEGIDESDTPALLVRRPGVIADGMVLVHAGSADASRSAVEKKAPSTSVSSAVPVPEHSSPNWGKVPSIRWLHLSDLHAGSAGTALRNELFDELANEIRGMAREIGVPDLILFTGDLAFSGKKDEFDEVDAVLARIVGWLRHEHPDAPAPLLFAVPGNHDLVRPTGRLKRECRILEDYDNGDEEAVQELRKELWKDQNPELIAALFQHYMTWQKARVIGPLAEAQRQGDRCRVAHASFFPGDLSAVIEKDGFQLALVGLNSSWIQYTGGDFVRKLHIPIEQFQAALPADVPGDFLGKYNAAFLLMHHPPDWLSPAARKTFEGAIYKPDRFDLCLFGHMHEGRSEVISMAGGKPRNFFQAPSVFGLEGYGTSEERRAFGYAWGEIRADSGLRIWPRKPCRKADGSAPFERDPHFHYEGKNDWLWIREPREVRRNPDPHHVEHKPRVESPASHFPDYAAWAHKHFEHLPMVGLGSGDLELTLDEVYVPLTFAPRERGGWSPGPGKEQGHREAPESVDLREALTLAGDRHLFVRGEPGSGKTTALKKLLWSLLSTDSPSGFDGRALGLPVDTVPVFLRMRDLVGPSLDRDFGEVLDDALVASTRPSTYVEGAPAISIVPPGVGRWLWDRGRVLLLLDGLDEIATREARRRVCRRVENLVEEGEARGIRVVASSRFAGIEKEGSINLDSHRFLHLDVRPLDDARIRQLVEKWYAAAGRARSRMRREHEDLGAARGSIEAQRLLDALQRNASIKLMELASTPLFLTLLCLVTEHGGQMPKRRVDFFRACLDTLLGIRASARAGERLLTLDESLDLLGAVAWGMHKEERQYDLDVEKLRALLAEPLRGFQNQRTRRPVVTFPAVVRWFCDVGGVLVEYAQGEHGFLHLGLQEYLAARYAATYPAEGIEMLATHFESSWWREVALLFVALPGYRHFGPLMERVIALGKLMSEREHVYQCLSEAHARDLRPFLELIADRGALAEQRLEALRLVQAQADDKLIELASEIALEPLTEETDEGAVRVWTELRRLAEQVEAHAPPRVEASHVEEAAKGVLVICHAADEVRARELERSMKGWGWEAGVTTSLRAEEGPWHRARAFVVLAGPEGHGAWEETESRRCLVEMVRRGLSVASALSGGTDASVLPAFLQTRPHASLGVNVLESRLPAVLAGMLEVTVPGLSVALIEAGAAEALAGQSFVEERTGIRFLWVPGGEFWMGSETDEEDADADEQPRHLVEVSGYWLAETPVTNRQYEIFLQEQRGNREPSYWRDRQYNQPEQPVVGVSWLEAREFCRWLSEVSGQRMELPTEAQWEFASTGKEGRKYPWGHEAPDETRAHYGNSWDDAPMPVGSLPAGRGPYGHLDLAGNVWEWCRDAWDGDEYESRGEMTVDPEGPDAEDTDPGVGRACRGGALGNEPWFLRSSYRYWSLALARIRHLGFRVAAFPRSG